MSEGWVSVHLRYLRRCGFCRLAPEPAPAPAPVPATPRQRRVHELYRLLMLTLTSVYLLQECVYAYQERRDMDKLARVMFLLLCHITSIAKQVVFHTRADQIDTLLADLDEAEAAGVRGCAGGRARALVSATAAGAARFARAYSGCAVLTCTLWVVFPIMYHTKGIAVELPFWVHFDYSTSSLRFAAVVLYSYYVTTLVGIANTTMDAFMATVLNQCKTQLKILRMNLSSVPDRAHDIVTYDSNENYDEVVMRLLLRCLVHYNMITRNARSLQDIFGTSILVQFAIGGWILCMAAYKIVSLDVLSIEFASMTLFISCILTELFLYCYYGNEVTVESGGVVEAMYMMRWRRAARAAPWRRALLLAMERAKRPLRPAAGLVVPLSLDTFIKIIRSSYTFYAVLRQTK